MALINCPDCSSSVSDQAACCVKCGRPIRRDTRKKDIKTYCKKLQLSMFVMVENGFVIIMTGFLGMVVKLIAMLIKEPDFINKLSFTEIFRYLIAESAFFVIGAYMILGIGIRLKLLDWKSITKTCAPFAYGIFTAIMFIMVMHLSH